MANTLTDIMPKILAMGLRTLRKRLVLPQLVNRDFSDRAAQRGQTIDVAVPPTVSARDVAPGVTAVAAPDLTYETRPINLDNWKEAAIHLTDKERLEVLDEAVEQAVDAAVNALAEEVNSSLFVLYKDIYNSVGTAGTTPFAADYATATAARKKLNNESAPLPDRRLVIDPDAEENAINLSEFADSSFTGGGDVIIEGDIGRKLGFDWFMDQQVPVHAAGSITGAPTVSGAHAAGVSSVTVATAAGEAVALNDGDIINFAGDTQDYVVTADADAGASTTVEVFISPDLVVALAGGEAVTLVHTANATQNLAFQRGAFALAIRPLGQPQAPGSSVMSMTDPATGIPLRLEVSRQNKQDYWSFDILWGVGTVRPELAVRLLG